MTFRWPTKAREDLAGLPDLPGLGDQLFQLAHAGTSFSSGAMAQRELSRAQAHVAELLVVWDRDGSLFPANNAFRAYLTIYQVLASAGDPRAGEILTRAHTELRQWAANCPDEETRRSFLENVPWNQEIVREWQRAHPGTSG